MHMAFSADSRFLAVSIDSCIVVWEVATGVQVTPPISMKLANDLHFDDQGRRLLVACVDKSVRVIDLSPASRSVEELSEFARLLANRTLDANSELIPLHHEEAQKLWDKFHPKP